MSYEQSQSPLKSIKPFVKTFAFLCLCIKSKQFSLSASQLRR